VWAKAAQFAAGDQALIKVSVGGGPFVTIRTFTSAESTGSYVFYGGSAIPLGHSWYPATASSIVLEFESRTTTGRLSIDDVRVRALIAPAGGGTNQPPTANAGPDQTVADSDGDGAQAVTLSGAASADPDGSIATYEWRQGTALLGQGVTLNRLFAVGEHTITLTVTDNGGATASDTVLVSVPAGGSAGSLAADGFESASFTGGTGRWVGSWSTGGDTSVRTNRDGPHGGSSHVRLRGTSAFLRRTVDLLGASGARLTFWGKATSFDGNDQLLVEVSVNGGSFTRLHTVTNAASDGTYRLYDVPLTGVAATSNVRIEFDSNVSSGSFFVDDVAIVGSAAPAVNQAPTADAGGNQADADADGNGSQGFTLDGRASADADGTIASYVWREGSTVLGSGATLAVTLGVGAHTVTLTVTDDDGATSSDSTLITVTPNQAPTVVAGADLTVNDGDLNGVETVTVSGNGSSDPDGTISRFEWRLGSTLLGTGASLTTTLAVGTHTLTLTAVDNGGATASDSVVITVLPASTTPQPAGDVSISGPSRVDRGDRETFTVLFTNTGNTTLDNVELTFAASPSDRLRDVSPAARVAVGSVAPGATITRTWSGRGNSTGSATATAEAFSGGVRIDAASHAFTVRR
jgi:hypothetical protein